MQASGRASRIVSELTEPFSGCGSREELPSSISADSVFGPLFLEADLEGNTVRKCAIVTGGLCAVVLTAAGPVRTLIVLIASIILASAHVLGRARKRRLALERDLPTLLTSMASSVRAGVDPLVALDRARDYFGEPSVLRKELEHFHAAISSGSTEEAAIAAFCASIRHPDLELFRACVLLSRRQGSALADPLHRIARVVRQRQSFRRKTRAALAMHRMSALGIALCALLICGIQAVMNLEGIKLALAHPVGAKAILAGLFLMFAGVVWMLCFGREKVA